MPMIILIDDNKGDGHDDDHNDDHRVANSEDRGKKT